jgi:hypothetical protein
MKQTDLWYKNAVFYEVYVRAFSDSNGDGHGDLQGLITVDYLQRLGFVWLPPVYAHRWMTAMYRLLFDSPGPWRWMTLMNCWRPPAHAFNRRSVFNHT